MGKKFKIFMKRRELDESFESSWQRIDEDDFKKNRVLSMSEISKKINFSRYDLNSFEYEPVNVELENTSGFFNDETINTSFFHEKLSRIFTKCKIQVQDQEDLTYSDFFEGVLTRPRRTLLKGSIKIKIEPLHFILNLYSMKDLDLTGDKTLTEIFTAIKNNSKIAKFISNVKADADVPERTLTGLTDSTESIWSFLKKIAIATNSYLHFHGDVLEIKLRTTTTGTVTKKYYSSLTKKGNDILSFGEYDDEGSQNSILSFSCSSVSGGKLTAKATDIFEKKYLSTRTVSVNFDEIKSDAERQNALDNLRNYWEKPRRSVDISVYFNKDLDLFKVLDFEIDAREKGGQGVAIWDRFKWNDGSVWGGTSTFQFHFGYQKVFTIQSIKTNVFSLVSKLKLKEF